MRVYQNDKLRRLGIEFKAPRQGDAGYDLFAVAELEVAPSQRALVETGLHLEIPAGNVGLVKDRSSVAAAGLHTVAGVIDSSYRGELKIAQLLLPLRREPIALVETLDDLSVTERGAGGFGSTDN